MASLSKVVVEWQFGENGHERIDTVIVRVGCLRFEMRFESHLLVQMDGLLGGGMIMEGLMRRYRCTYGWMDGWMGGWVGGGMERLMGRYKQTL